MAKPPGNNAFIFIFIAVTLNMIGFGVIIPVMPQLVMEVTGENVANAAKWGGYLSVAYGVMQFIMMPIIGGLSDRFGRRPILLGSMAAYAVDFLIMAIAPTIGIILVARIFAGAFAATFSTANAYVADITPPDERAGRFGILGAAFGLGFIIGPGIGGFLGSEFGPRAPFYFVAGLGAVNFLFGLFVLPETLGEDKRRKFEWKRANALGSLVQFAKYPIMLPIAGVLFLSQLAHWTYPSVWSYYAEEKFAWTPDLIGASLMFVGLTSAIVQGGLTRIAVPKFGERATAVFAMCVTAIAYVGFALATTGWMVYALIAFSALGGLAQPALQGIMSRTIPEDAQGELQGAVSAIVSITMIMGTLVMTQIFARFSDPEPGGIYFPGASFLLASILEVFAILLIILAFRRIVRPRSDDPPSPT